MFNDCWFLTGPTASGKTQIGIELARRLRAEILSLDSMAVYRRMDIGTAKPTVDERAAVPHHLIDIADSDDEFSVAQYAAAAGQASREIAARGREVLFVGGTPLYLKALLRGLFDGPPADWQLRTELAAIADRDGPQALHDRLTAVDPLAAQRLAPADRRRIIRAIEVYEKTGRTISECQQQFDRARPASECRVFVLDRPRAELYERINHRVDAMFAAGLVDEVRALTVGVRPLGRSASQAVGYREVLAHLAGELSLEAAVELVKTRTRQFAKRQLTWFRSLGECRFVPMMGEVDSAAIADEIIARGRESLRGPLP
jgi:tRNA dimethylallyltransferase